MKTEFLLAAASSGAGKTTVAMGLLRALARQGVRVQPFKCGPDYIDTQFHAIAARTAASVNLDMWMQGEAGMRTIYNRYAREAEVCLVEGVMGLFDGYDRDRGSSAEVARLLDLPVVLVAGAQSTAYSVAALLYGFRHFDERVRVAGVIFNQVASPSHYAFLRAAAADAGVPCLGYVLRDADLTIPTRHLGLTLTAREEMDALAERAADAIRDLDLTPLGRKRSERPDALTPSGRGASDRASVYVARDAAFSFCYQTTLDALAALGEVHFFSPLANEPVPPEADFVYLPGGYPELFLPELEQSQATKLSLCRHADSGTPVVAECGGMMYLGAAISDAEGKAHEMAGVLPLTSTMQDARLHLGYRAVTLQGVGRELALRGHEFHYSRLEQTSLPSIAQQMRAGGQTVDTRLMRQGSVLAGYTHWYWTPQNLREIIKLLTCHEP